MSLLKKKNRPKASQIIDWTKRSYSFLPHDGGLRGSLQSWTGHGPRPKVGDLLGLRAKEGGVAVYRVTGFAPEHFAADYDGFIARVEFVPGSTIEDDR